MESLNSAEHAHVPFPILLLKLANNWRQQVIKVYAVLILNSMVENYLKIHKKNLHLEVKFSKQPSPM